jgi:hypothetical protein
MDSPIVKQIIPPMSITAAANVVFGGGLRLIRGARNRGTYSASSTPKTSNGLNFPEPLRRSDIGLTTGNGNFDDDEGGEDNPCIQTDRNDGGGKLVKNSVTEEF